MAEYVKPDRLPDDTSNTYLTRIVLSYAEYLNQYYDSLNIQSEYLLAYRNHMINASFGPHKLQETFACLCMYVKNNLIPIVHTREDCVDYIRAAITTNVPADKVSQIREDHIAKLADITWVFIETSKKIGKK